MSGKPVTGADLLAVGERIVNLERLYNVRQGLTRADDRLPARFTTEPAPLYEYEEDAATGEMTRSAEPIRHGLLHDFDAMLDRAYDLRGWTCDGIPTSETLARFGGSLSHVEGEPGKQNPLRGRHGKPLEGQRP